MIINFLLELFMVFLIIFILISLFSIYSYNRLQTLGQKIKSANSNIEISMKKREDLINKLLDITKNYEDYEKFIYIKNSENLKDIISNYKCETNLNQKFPKLKMDIIYKDLIHSIKELENQLSSKRELYNEYVEKYNSKRVSFPNILFLNKFKFEEAPYFDIHNKENIKNFTTDDGQVIKNIIIKSGEQVVKTTTQATNQATDLTKKGMQMAKDSIDSIKSNIQTKEKEEQEEIAKNEIVIIQKSEEEIEIIKNDEIKSENMIVEKTENENDIII